MVSRSVYFRTQDAEGCTCQFFMSKRSSLSADDLAQVISNYHIPVSYRARLPEPSESCAATIAEGCMVVHEISFRLGFCLPLHPFGVEVFCRSFLAPAQLHPNGWAQLAGFFVLCQERGFPPTADLLFTFYCFFTRPIPLSLVYTL